MTFWCAHGVTISLYTYFFEWKQVGKNKWVKTGGWLTLKQLGENARVKIGGWKWTAELEEVIYSIKSVISSCILHRNVAILYWFKLFYSTTPRESLLPVRWWLFNPSPASSSATFFYTCVYVCVCVCVCVKKSVCVCHTLRNSAEICVAIRKLAKTGDLGRVVCGYFGCYCVHDKCCPLTPLASADISHDASDHVCVHVWLPVCLCMSITTTYTGEHCNWCRVVQL